MYILPELIQELVPFLDILKTVKIVEEKDQSSTNFDRIKGRLIDEMIIKHFNFIVDKSHFVLPKYLIDASKLVESENCWKPFYKVFFLCLTYESYFNTKSILEDIGNIGIQIKYLYFSVNSIEELDCLTNPEYFSKGLSELEICFKDTIPLSDIFFYNINRIKLKKISFEFDDEVNGSFDIIKILKNTQRNIELNLRHVSISNPCTLCFTNVPIKIIQSNCEDLLFVVCEQFICLIEIYELFENFWFSSINIDSLQSNWETFIHVKISKEYKFNWYKLLNESEVFKTYKTKFPDHSPMSECKLIIPMKYLYSAYYDRDTIHSLLSHKDKLKFMNEISKAQKISCSISYCSELQYLSEWASIFPKTCRYSIVEYLKPDSMCEFESYIK